MTKFNEFLAESRYFLWTIKIWKKFKNTNKCYLVNLDCKMCDLNLENVNLNEIPNDYIKNDGFKYCKLILKKKEEKRVFWKIIRGKSRIRLVRQMRKLTFLKKIDTFSKAIQIWKKLHMVMAKTAKFCKNWFVMITAKLYIPLARRLVCCKTQIKFKLKF